MSRAEAVTKKGNYHTVIDGTFRVQVPKDHPDAILREWSTKDGRSGEKYEKHIKALFGKVTGVSITDGEYGKNLNVYLDEDEETGDTPIISLKTSNDRYGEDLLKKLPALERGVEYRFLPYVLKDKDTGREKRGIAVHTRDESDKFTVRVTDFFTEPPPAGAPEGTKGKYVNGFPEPTDEDRDDWEFYYKKVGKFLVKYAEENVVPKFADARNSFGIDAKTGASIEYPEDEVNPEDIPF